MFKKVLPMIWPDKKLATNKAFVDANINVYTHLDEIIKECRAQHGSRFCVDHFNAIMKVFESLLRRFSFVSWSLPKHVHRLYSGVYMSRLRCNVYEDHKTQL